MRVRLFNSDQQETTSLANSIITFVTKPYPELLAHVWHVRKNFKCGYPAIQLAEQTLQLHLCEMEKNSQDFYSPLYEKFHEAMLLCRKMLFSYPRAPVREAGLNARMLELSCNVIINVVTGYKDVLKNFVESMLNTEQGREGLKDACEQLRQRLNRYKASPSLVLDEAMTNLVNGLEICEYALARHLAQAPTKLRKV